MSLDVAFPGFKGVSLRVFRLLCVDNVEYRVQERLGYSTELSHLAFLIRPVRFHVAKQLLTWAVSKQKQRPLLMATAKIGTLLIRVRIAFFAMTG